MHYNCQKRVVVILFQQKKTKSLGRQPTSSPIRSRALPGAATPSLPTKVATAGYSTCPAGSQMEQKTH